MLAPALLALLVLPAAAVMDKVRVYTREAMQEWKVGMKVRRSRGRERERGMGRVVVKKVGEVGLVFFEEEEEDLGSGDGVGGDGDGDGGINRRVSVPIPGVVSPSEEPGSLLFWYRGLLKSLAYPESRLSSE